MEKLQPTTFNQIKCYSLCKNLKDQNPAIEDEVLEKIYNHLIQNIKYKVVITLDGMISFYNDAGQAQDALRVSNLTPPALLTLSAGLYRVTTPGSSSRGYRNNNGTNNNNNNNNNNNG